MRGARRAAGLTTAQWHGRRLLFLMAAAPEYGPALRARIRPVMTGVGPVEAAVTTADTLRGLAGQGALPDLVVSLGSAGSARLAQGAVYQASHVGYRDMDATALGFAPGITPFSELPATLVPGPAVPGLAQASLSTGAAVVSGAGYGTVDAEMVDMESFAVLRACQRHGCPLVCLRGISDGATPLQGLDDWTALLGVVDARLADALDTLGAALARGWPGG